MRILLCGEGGCRVSLTDPSWHGPEGWISAHFSARRGGRFDTRLKYYCSAHAGAALSALGIEVSNATPTVRAALVSCANDGCSSKIRSASTEGWSSIEVWFYGEGFHRLSRYFCPDHGGSPREAAERLREANFAGLDEGQWYALRTYSVDAGFGRLLFRFARCEEGRAIGRVLCGESLVDHAVDDNSIFCAITNEERARVEQFA